MDREQVLEKHGLAEATTTPASPAPTTGPSSTPTSAPAVVPPSAGAAVSTATSTGGVLPRPPWLKRPEPSKPAAETPEIEAGGRKFKTVEELSKSYGELQSVYTKTTQELAELKKTPPATVRTEIAQPAKTEPGAAPSEIKEEEVPDPVLEPEKFQAYMRSIPTRATEIALQLIAAREQTEQYAEKWRKDNPDLVEAEQVVAQRVFGDPRIRSVKTEEERNAIVQEHTDFVRNLLSGVARAAREEERNRLQGIPPSEGPSVTSEQPPPGNREEQPASATDDVDSYIAGREAIASRQRGYGFSRDDASRTMNR